MAFLEWRRSFSLRDVPRGVGARDYYLLTLFALLTSLFVFIAVAATVTMYHRLQETLLGALEPGRQNVRFERNWLKTDEVGPRSLLAMLQDPALDGYTISPKRVSSLGNGQIQFPRKPEDGVKGANLRSLLASMPAVALPLDAPFWSWLTSESGTSFEQPATCAHPSFQRVAVANRFLMDRNLPPDEGHYLAYRAAILARNENTVLARYLPPKIESWSALSHLILEVTENVNGVNAARYHPFRTTWRDGLPMAERPALVVPLGLHEALAAAAGRTSTFVFAPEGCGAPGERYTQIIADLPWEDPDAAPDPDFPSATEIVKKMQAVAACLGPGAVLFTPEGEPDRRVIEVVRSEAALKRRAPRASWRSEDVVWCFESENVAIQGNSAMGGSIYFTRMVFGHAVSPIVVGERPFWGGIAGACKTMDRRDRNFALSMGHQSHAYCKEPSDPLAPFGLLVSEPYDEVDFQPPGHPPASSTIDALARSLQEAVDPPTQRPEPIELLSMWSIAAAKSRVGQSGTFPLFPEITTLPNEARGEILELLGDSAVLDQSEDNFSVLRLSPSYERALRQFDVSIRFLSALSLILAVIATLFVVFITDIMIKGVLERRLRQFSLLATFGFSKRDLRAMALFQVGLSSTVGVVGGLILTLGLSWGGNVATADSRWVRSIYQTLGFDYSGGIVIVPHWTEFATWYFVIAFGFVAIAWRAARYLGVTTSDYPSDLAYAAQ